MKKNLVVLTGAGISAESGLKTFRDSGGLWEGYDVMEVASVDGWRQNPQKVQEFYNMRRKQAATALPNAGHKALVALEASYNVTIVTQNVDDLHEKAGSSNIIHLHGELRKVVSEKDPDYVRDIGNGAIHMGDTCPNGGQLRPAIVWFGEMVPMMAKAAEVAAEAEILLVIGTSLLVYPAASLVTCVSPQTQIYVVDPVKPDIAFRSKVTYITETAAVGTPKLVADLLSSARSNHHVLK